MTNETRTPSPHKCPSCKASFTDDGEFAEHMSGRCTPSPADGRVLLCTDPVCPADDPHNQGALGCHFARSPDAPGSVAGAVPSPIEPQPDDYSGAEVFDPGDGKPLCPMCDDTGEVETEDGWVQRCSCQDDHCGIVEVDPADFDRIDARELVMAEGQRMWTLAAATLERDVRLHDMIEDEQRVMIGAVLSAAERHYEAQSATIARLNAEVERMREALCRIAEGNLGDDPWQANYRRIKQVALAALAPKEG